MKILVTGATGMVGTELVALLISQGHSVNCLTTSKDKIISKPGYYCYFWNPEKGQIDENCLIGVDAIVHLAGASISKRWTESYKKEILESRVLSAQLLYKTLQKNPHQVKQFVSASAIGIYPESHEKVYDEHATQTATGFLADVVKQWEAAADQFGQLGLKVCKLRTGLVLSSKGGALPEMAKPVKFGLGANMGDGSQIQSWIHLEDLVRLYHFLIDNKLEGTYNGVAPNPVSYAALNKALAKKLEKPLFLPNIPQFIMKLVLGEMASLLFSSKNVSAYKVIHAGFRFQYPTLEMALDEIYKN